MWPANLHDWLLGQRSCLKRTELAALSAANLATIFSESRLEGPDVPEGRQPTGL